MQQEKITLGQYEVDVYGQRHAYITNKVGKAFGQVIEGAQKELSGDVDVRAILRYALSEGAYPLLATLIPTYGQCCPEYEFMGYASKEAYEAGEYDEDADQSPTVDEIYQAFMASMRVNRFDALGILKNVIDPKALKAQFTILAMEAMEGMMPSGNSVIEQSVNDGSDPSTSSGTTPPTSTEPED